MIDYINEAELVGWLEIHASASPPFVESKVQGEERG